MVLLILATAGTYAVHAETVTQKMASRVAQTFFNTLHGISTKPPKLVWNGRELTTNRLFTPFYVYNSPAGGYVAIAADTKAFPILSYSRNQKFDRSHVGDDERRQFERYAREIELIRYDSRVPERAVEAWAKMPAYLDKVVRNPYDTPDYRRLTPEAQEELEQLDRRNSWIMMPTAVEFDLYNPEQYRDYTLDDITGTEEPYVPFSFYEDFLRGLEEEERTRAAAYERILTPDEATVQRWGGGHYTIQLPEEGRLLRVYSVAGARTQEKTFRGTNCLALDLSGMPAGYYIALTMGRSGRIYSFKLYR